MTTFKTKNGETVRYRGHRRYIVVRDVWERAARDTVAIAYTEVELRTDSIETARKVESRVRARSSARMTFSIIDTTDGSIVS